MMDPMRALEKIWQIVHTPTSKTPHRIAIDHYAADFAEIRATIKPFIDAGFMKDPNSPHQSEDRQ